MGATNSRWTRTEIEPPHRRRAPRLLAGLVALAFVAIGCGRTEPDRTVLHDATPSTAARSAAASLPVGGPDSPYWVAHVVPAGYRIVSADDRPDPFWDRMESHTTTYHDGGGDDGDAALHVSTIEGDLLAGTPLTSDPPPKGYERIEIRGHRALRYPMHDDGEDYGTTLLWEERKNLWIMVEAAEPLTAADAQTVAAGLQPFPANQWKDLQTGVDIMGSLEPDSTEDFTRVPLGGGTANGVEWSIQALIPSRWGELPADRRTSCLLLHLDGKPVDQPTCAMSPGVIERGGQGFVVGLAPKGTRRVTVRTSAKSFEAQLFDADRGPAVRYWIAALGISECRSVIVSFDPSDTTGRLAAHMTGEVGPTEGCGVIGPDSLPGREPGKTPPTPGN